MARITTILPFGGLALLLACAPDKYVEKTEVAELPQEARVDAVDREETRAAVENAPLNVEGEGDYRGTDLEKGPIRAVDLNRATAEELDELPGVDRGLAEAIVNFRMRNGSFTKVEDLLQVRGMTPERLDQIRPWVTIVMATPDLEL